MYFKKYLITKEKFCENIGTSALIILSAYTIFYPISWQDKDAVLPGLLGAFSIITGIFGASGNKCYRYITALTGSIAALPAVILSRLIAFILWIAGLCCDCAKTGSEELYKFISTDVYATYSEI